MSSVHYGKSHQVTIQWENLVLPGFQSQVQGADCVTVLRRAIEMTTFHRLLV